MSETRNHLTPRKQPRLLRGVSAFWSPRLWGVVALVGLMGCGRSPVEQHIDTSIGHLQAAHEMLQAEAPSIEKLSIAVAQYRSKHRGEFRKLRQDGEKLLGQLEADERKKVMDAARKRALGLVQRIEAAAARYPDKRMAMRLVRPLIVSGTPRGLKAKGQMPWMPKMPKVEDPDHTTGKARGVPPGAHGPGDPHGHDHGLPPSELLRKKARVAPAARPPKAATGQDAP